MRFFGSLGLCGPCRPSGALKSGRQGAIRVARLGADADRAADQHLADHFRLECNLFRLPATETPTFLAIPLRLRAERVRLVGLWSICLVLEGGQPIQHALDL